MAGVNVKMGVSGVNEFKRAMNDSKEAVRTLNEALKANEAQLKLTGDEEAYAERQASTLKAMIEAQKTVFENATKALQEMDRQGVNPASSSFQKMQQTALRAQTDLNKMQLELRNVESGATDAKEDTESMNSEMKKIGDGVNWQNVTEGLNTVISKLESGARSAINFGKKMLRYVTNSADWADELLEMSQETGYSVEQLQAMQNVAEIVDTSVDAIIAAKNRMKNAAGSSGGRTAIEEMLGISLSGQTPDDLFWEIGDALLHMEDAYEQEQAAQDIFGRNWHELLPLFLTGRDAYEEMLSEQRVMSAEDVDKLGEVSDAMAEVTQQLELMKNQFIADNADKILALLQWFVDNFETVKNGIIAIGAALGAMKLGAFALDLQKTIKGFKELGLFGGGGRAVAEAGAEAAETAGTAGTTSNAIKFAAGAGKLGLTAAVALAPAIIAAVAANLIPDEYKLGNDAYLMSAEGVTADQIIALKEWATAMNQIAAMEDLYGTGDFDEIEYGRLWDRVDALSAQVQQGDLWNRYWTNYVAGQEGGNGTMYRTDVLDQMLAELGYSASADRMVSAAEKMAYTASGKTSLTSSDIANFNGLPGEIARAVENANIRIYIDGELAGASVAPYVNTAMGGMIRGYTK